VRPPLPGLLVWHLTQHHLCRTGDLEEALAHSLKAEKAYKRHHRQDNHVDLVHMSVGRSHIYSSTFDVSGAKEELDKASEMLPLCVICHAGKRKEEEFNIAARGLDIERQSLHSMTGEELTRRLEREKDLLSTAAKIPNMEHEISLAQINHAFTLCLANEPELAMVELEKVLSTLYATCPFSHELLEIHLLTLDPIYFE
jgi:hypothetical protein